MKSKVLGLLCSTVICLITCIPIYAAEITGSTGKIERSGMENTEGINFDSTTNTLTLTDYSGDSVETTEYGTCQIYSKGDLNLVLKGTNELDATAEYGIYCEGNLTISGDGSLSIANTQNGIYAGKSVSVEAGTIMDTSSEHSICVHWGNFTLNNGKISVDADIYTENGGSIVINEGELEAVELRSDQDLLVKNGFVKSRLIADDYLQIDNGTIEANGIETADLQINDGTVTSIVESGYGISARQGDIHEINGGTIYAEGPSGGITYWIDFNIKGGKVVAKGTGEDSIGMNGGWINISAGEVQIEGKAYGIYYDAGFGTIIIDGGNVDIKSAGEGIGTDGYGAVEINGGKTTIEAGTYAINCLGYGGNITIAGGEAELFGNIQALKASEQITLGGMFKTGKGAEYANVAAAYYGEPYLHISYNGNIDDTPVEVPVVLQLGNQKIEETSSGNGWSYNAENNTLTLEDYHSDAADAWNGGNSGLYSNGDINLVLKGENVFSSESQYGVYVSGNLSVSGDGSLEIQNKENGIYCGKAITIESGEIIDSSSGYSICAYWGDFIQNGGKISSKAEVFTDNGGCIVINDGTIEAQELVSNQDMRIENGFVKSILKVDRYLQINGGIIEANGIRTEDLQINDGTVTSIVESGYGISARQGDIHEINGGTVYAEGPSGGITYWIDFNIKGGKVVAKGTGEDSVGMNGGWINISAGEVQIEGKAYGIYYDAGFGTIIIDGGNVDIKSTGEGIGTDGYGAVEINGGKTTIEAGTYAINCPGYGGNITIAGGETELYSNIQALKASEGIVLNGIFETGKNAENAETASEYYGEKYVHIIGMRDPEYKDVNSNDWFYEYVKYVYNIGLMTGTSSTTFAPNMNLSRSQFATILWRMNDSPVMEYSNVFTDVPEGEWYTNAVIWASETGVVLGKGDGTFGVTDNITREQMALMMYRYAAAQEYDIDQSADISGFKDDDKVSSWAKEAVKWAVANKIINGKGTTGLLDPQGKASRAECATIIKNFMETYK